MQSRNVNFRHEGTNGGLIKNSLEARVNWTLDRIVKFIKDDETDDADKTTFGFGFGLSCLC